MGFKNAFLARIGQVRAILGNEEVIPDCHGALRVLGQNAQPGLDRLRLQPVVRIQKDNVAAPTLANPTIAACRQTAVLLPYISHWKLLRNCGAAVGRAIVHDDDFHRLVTLRQGALDRFLEIRPAVVAGNDNRDQRTLTQ